MRLQNCWNSGRGNDRYSISMGIRNNALVETQCITSLAETSVNTPFIGPARYPFRNNQLIASLYNKIIFVRWNAL